MCICGLFPIQSSKGLLPQHHCCLIKKNKMGSDPSISREFIKTRTGAQLPSQSPPQGNPTCSEKQKKSAHTAHGGQLFLSPHPDTRSLGGLDLTRSGTLLKPQARVTAQALGWARACDGGSKEGCGFSQAHSLAQTQSMEELL